MVKQWFVYALRDYKMAKGLFNASEEFLPGAAFHAQQSMEKSLKGFLASREVRAPKTHSLDTLVVLVATVDAGLAKKLKGLDRFSKYAVEYRYPSATKKRLTAKQVNNAIVSAKKVYDLLLELSE